LLNKTFAYNKTYSAPRVFYIISKVLEIINLDFASRTGAKNIKSQLVKEPIIFYYHLSNCQTFLEKLQIP